MFTQYDDKGVPHTLRLYSNKPLIIEAESLDKLPKEVKQAMMAKFIIVKEIVDQPVNTVSYVNGGE